MTSVNNNFLKFQQERSLNFLKFRHLHKLYKFWGTGKRTLESHLIPWLLLFKINTQILLVIGTHSVTGRWWLWNHYGPDQSKQNFNLFKERTFCRTCETKKTASWSFSTVSMHGGSSMSPSHLAVKRGPKHERERDRRDLNHLNFIFLSFFLDCCWWRRWEKHKRQMHLISTFSTFFFPPVFLNSGLLIWRWWTKHKREIHSISTISTFFSLSSSLDYWWRRWGSSYMQLINVLFSNLARIPFCKCL